MTPGAAAGGAAVRLLLVEDDAADAQLLRAALVGQATQRWSGSSPSDLPSRSWC